MAYTYYTFNCAACGKVVSTRDHRQRTCSRQCAQLQRFPDRASLFWSKVQKTETCWLFTGSLNPKGYGVIRVNNKPALAHRWSYEYTYGPITNGLFVCHRCDVRNCVNPEHFFLGTKSDNAIDMHRKGRNHISAGEENGVSKLTAEQVREIRASKERLKPLASRFGVTLSAISAIRHRQNWKHVA